MLNLTQLAGFGAGGEQIYYVGSATGTTSATLPDHQAGDLLIAFAFRDGSTTVPSTPAGWTVFAGEGGGSGGANSCSFKFGYKVAASSSETSGTWTNATSLIVVVMRNVSISGSGYTFYVESDSGTTGPDTFGYFYRSDFGNINGPIKILCFAGHRSTNTNLTSIPSFSLLSEPEITPDPVLPATLIASTVDATDTAVAYLTDTYEVPNLGYIGPQANYTFSGTSSGYFAVSIGLLLN